MITRRDVFDYIGELADPKNWSSEARSPTPFVFNHEIESQVYVEEEPGELPRVNLLRRISAIASWAAHHDWEKRE